MSERRRATRKPVGDRLTVTDTMTGEVMGVVGNLSHDGVLLILNRAVQSDTLYQVQFRIPDGLGMEPIEVGIHEQWIEPMRHGAGGGEYWAGFRIIDIAPDDRERLVAFVGE